MVENISNLNIATSDASTVQHNLLLIDDELDIVTSLYRQFRKNYAVYRAIVELHGGHIEVDSVWGKGTSFKVMIPIELAQF